MHALYPTFSIALTHQAPLRVLLVDDSSIVRMSTVALLSAWQMELHVVNDGRQALRKARAQAFDVVLMDLDMPVMDGFDASRKIRLLEATEPARHRASIIAHTGDDWEPLVARMVSAGIDSVLVKPSMPDLMCRTLHQWAAGKVYRHPGRDCDRPSGQASRRPRRLREEQFTNSESSP